MKSLREAKGISLEDLADRLDIPPECLDDIEKGQRRLSRDTLKEVAQILEVPESYFYADEAPVDQVSLRAVQRLKSLREQKGISLAELARRTGISPTHISEIERAQSGGSLKVWEKLARELGVTLGYFFREVEEETLGQKLRKLRTSRGLTQKELAQKVNLSYSLVAQIESGRVQPAISTLTRLARELGVSPCYFLTDEGQEEPGLGNTATSPEIRRLLSKLSQLSPRELKAVEDLVDHLLSIRRELLQEKEMASEPRV